MRDQQWHDQEKQWILNLAAIDPVSHQRHIFDPAAIVPHDLDK